MEDTDKHWQLWGALDPYRGVCYLEGLRGLGTDHVEVSIWELLTVDVPERKSQFAAGKRQEIVVVATHFTRWTVLGPVIQTGHSGQPLRNDLFLYFTRDLEFAVQAFAPRHLSGNGLS